MHDIQKNKKVQIYQSIAENNLAVLNRLLNFYFQKINLGLKFGCLYFPLHNNIIVYSHNNSCQLDTLTQIPLHSVSFLKHFKIMVHTLKKKLFNSQFKIVIIEILVI